MPIAIMDARTALQNKRANPAGRWPTRAQGDNRIEPYARPWFNPTFSFKKGATVFTIGSCFARHVEKALQDRGFRIPTREFWVEGNTGKHVDNLMLDNYGVASIYNEIRWALGEGAPYDPKLHLVEIYPGKFADLHISHLVPLGPFDEAAARRERIFKITRSVLEADAIVMTLGLAEVWYDKTTGIYLNSRPYEAVLKANPNRFELHILDYADVCDYLDRTFEIIFRRCKPSCNVLLTVSPVPMSATFSGNDICVANMYSKSVLRAGTEAIARKYDRIDYFSSYESVMLTERRLAWEDDLVHVRSEIVDLNVNAMISAYAEGGEESSSAQTRHTEKLMYRSSRASRDQLARAKALLSERKYSEAIEAARLVKDDGPVRAQALRVEGVARFRLGNPAEAEAIFRSSLKLRWNDAGCHGYLAQALHAQGKPAEALESARTALNFAPNVAAWIRLTVSLLLETHNADEAAQLLQVGLAIHPNDRVLLQLHDKMAKAEPVDA